MGDSPKPATAEELQTALESGEAKGELVDAMVFEIRMHRDAMLPSMLRATRLYTDELGALRSRVADLEYKLADAQIMYSKAAVEAGKID
jgi:hypothetical protein